MSSSKEWFAKSYEVYAYIRGLNFVIEEDIRQSLKSLKLTFSAFRILWILYFDSKESITMTDLKYLVQMNISNVFRQLTKLKEEGLVEIYNGEDARTKHISLTESGRVQVLVFLNAHLDHSNLEIIKKVKEIPESDYEKFIEVARFLSSDLVGPTFTNWAKESTNKIVELEK
ncbi:MarR family winged helix-turn-helix transcriptional regulator [Bacillus sp. PS06]|uniref:MarR family winged helix-turn-helix transcriptional regulator n=1 Tax=Bacillus sp. PS06 TaxID=2764176 RepID=UPI00177C9241|nr:winged helix DNA-binding protein [Bacillus sp. PS06]MBD8067874.1 winged helix DNA-binding protein [Bacillus sp. PS06]